MRPVLSTVTKCLRMLPPAMRWRWSLLVLVALSVAAAEAIAAVAIFALIQIITDPAQATRIPVAATIALLLPWSGDRAVILSFTTLVAVYHALKNLFLAATQYIRHKIVGESVAFLACTVVKGYLTVPYPFHFRRNSAELIRNADSTVHVVFGTVMSAAVAVVSEVLVALGIGIVLLISAPRITLIVATLVVSMIMLLLRVTRRLTVRYGRESHLLRRTILQSLQQALGGIKELRALGRERFFYDTFARAQSQVLSLGYTQATLAALPQFVIETVFVSGALVVIALATVSGRSNVEGLSLLGLFSYAAFRIVPSMNRITWRINEIRAGRRPVEDLFADFVLISKHDFDDLREQRADDKPFRDRIALDRVSYVYPGTDKKALDEVCLTIRCGESVGIVGPTGAGKSTLVDLLVGLLQPSSGRITIDGVDLAQLSRAWNRHIGYVPQAIFLTDDTLRRNIALGIPDDHVGEQRVWNAVRLAQLESFIRSLPAGLDTYVGERGVRLSGGERQRVGIARALYHDPEVLVFDEATSALDNATEAELTRAIEALRGEKTLVIIAHRLTTVRRCDRLAFVLDGRIVASGTFDELVARNEEFRRMVSTEAVERATHET
jgi:ATP-binding cassette subfamily C protein